MSQQIISHLPPRVQGSDGATCEWCHGSVLPGDRVCHTTLTGSKAGRVAWGRVLTWHHECRLQYQQDVIRSRKAAVG